MKTQKEKGSQIVATSIIWGFATGMLAISIPLVAITRSGVILPLAVVLGASGSTVAVWRGNNRQTKQVAKLTDELQSVKARLVDLETICSSHEFNIEEKFKQLESSQHDKQHKT